MTGIELVELEKRLREADLIALDHYKRGLADAPVIFKASGKLRATEGGIMTFVASEESPDRIGDIIEAKGWELKDFEANPVFMFMHNYTMPAIGTVPRVWIEGKQLLNTVAWDDADPFAQGIHGKYERGVMRAESVGFRALEFQEAGNTGGLRFTRQELLEISAVPVPAHPAALAKAMRNGRFTLVMPGLPDSWAKGVIGWDKAHPDGTPAASRDAAWDAGREVGAADVDDLRIMCAWVDSENADNKGGYKLPHHKAAGDHAVVFKALAAVVAVLNGGRGGADIPDADREGIYRHIAKHFSKDFEEEAPPLKSAKMSMDDILLLESTKAGKADMAGMMSEAMGHMKEAMSMMEEMAGMMEGKPEGEPEKAIAKAGAVLSRSNKGKLEQARALIAAVVASAEKPAPEEESDKGIDGDDGEVTPEIAATLKAALATWR